MHLYIFIIPYIRVTNSYAEFNADFKYVLMFFISSILFEISTFEYTHVCKIRSRGTPF